MNRHPVILEQLAPLLPRGPRTPETRLTRDLRLGEDGRRTLAAAIGEAWGIEISYRAAKRWLTLADVCATVADAREAQAA